MTDKPETLEDVLENLENSTAYMDFGHHNCAIAERIDIDSRCFIYAGKCSDCTADYIRDNWGRLNGDK